jgi:hypothetical protein
MKLMPISLFFLKIFKESMEAHSTHKTVGFLAVRHGTHPSMAGLMQ